MRCDALVNAPSRFKDLSLDAHDHQAVADWWCQAMGYRRRVGADGPRPASDPVPIVDPTGAGPLLWVAPVPEEKVVKNRMHLDVVGDVDALLALGATLVQPRGEDRDWDVLADPEGNEFCVFAP
ncbi:VOC family protein [Kineococcus sp. SYSU DK002]|uniref:VOC family protein n=1 Tax=Kineococcus sp. SYSU DK002 TaxID=3383123 RepID=UPI003D7D4470